ncbi:MAG: hypothetical protein DWQ01_11460 [Planctomycetota bacterium]|nr:MAG: hypothetical protein DWQ01_11460 [Planctomycetota bacterium]
MVLFFASVLLAVFPEPGGAETATVHFPHDTVYSLATCKLPSGVVEVVIVSSDQSRVLRSRNDGLTWEAVVGARLERNLAREILYRPGSQGPSFLIGTNYGVWAYDPVSEQVEAYSDGLPQNDRDVIDMDGPWGLDGTSILLTRSGSLYLRGPQDLSWTLSHATGQPALPGQSAVAVSPGLQDGASGAAGTLVAGVNGMLFYSLDSGAQWNVHPQFSTPASSPQDWVITAMALAGNYNQSGVLVLGRGRSETIGGRDYGELWRSQDFGQSFQKIRDLDTAVGALQATPIGPGGDRYFYMAGNVYPNYLHYRDQGIFRSQDGGLTWQDFTNAQDFILERGPGMGTGEPLETRVEQGFAFDPDFFENGKLWYGRAEGLFQSRDSGEHWQQRRFRPEHEARGIAAAVDFQGRPLVFLACYGSSTIAYDGNTGVPVILDDACPISYQKAIAVSPNFDQDGTLVVAGAEDLVMWFDTRMAPQNPWGLTGWVQPDLADPLTGQRFQGYPRVVVFSPHFDGRGVAGSDQTYFWNAWENPPMRTSDGGMTLERLDQLKGGGEVPFMHTMAVAPTYDASTAAGRTDVYGASGKTLYRLNDVEWEAILNFTSEVVAVRVAPNFSRPTNPRLYVLLMEDPYLLEVLDLPGGAFSLDLNTDLSPVRPTDLVIPDNFGSQPVLFASTWGKGVLRLDLNSNPRRWIPVGFGFPSWWTDSIASLPDFQQSSALVVGTQYGFVRGEDFDDAPWQKFTLSTNWDDVETSIMTYAPNDPANPQADRPWPWQDVAVSFLGSELEATGGRVLLTTHDQSYLLCSELASAVVLQTYGGPGTGSVDITVRDFQTGQHLRTVVQDLATLANEPQAVSLRVDLTGLQAVKIQVTADLDPGESFAFDGFLFDR